MPIKSQGTELYYVKPGDTPTLVKLHCPTGITGLGGAADQIETTCLSDTDDKQYTRGLGNPGQVSAPVNFDPQQVSHQDMFALKASGETLQWIIALSDGTAAPTLTGSTITPPTDRTSIQFSAYIADWALDIAANDIVKGTLTLQRSGSVTLTPKA
ncbi:hypothetical protein CAL14_05575 [Bordetella genomosp. 9]|uniref:phage tail tube protein n=1 Tax=Bordetella genomosp. 9 TaxID=1416803 RepID=UPI000A28FE99|nr:phage tail tube protein [Bordetella genomosp. 9]ARP89824.1 hypothetical protein CAL14_05575 [Bordetella genomosp. 9]